MAKNLTNRKNLGIALLIALVLMYLPLGSFLSTIAQVIILVVAILLLVK